MKLPILPAFEGNSDEVRDADGRVYLLSDVNASLARAARIKEVLLSIVAYCEQELPEILSWQDGSRAVQGIKEIAQDALADEEPNGT